MLKNPKKIVDSKTVKRLSSGILAAVAACAGCEKLNPQLPGQPGEDRKDDKLMRNTYSQITAEWVSVTGAVALALCKDRLQSDRLAAPFTHMQKNTITDP